MTVTSLPRTAGATAPRRRRSRIVLARLGGGLAVLLPIVLISTFISYSLGALSNSDPAATILGQDAATPAAVARLNRALGLNHPLIVQYWNWLTQALHGNLGRSYFSQIPVAQSIGQRLPVDLSIAVLAIILAVIIGGGAGTLAAVYRGSWFDRGVTLACSAASTLPAFVVGIILVVLFAVTAHLLPANGYVGPSTSVPQWLAHIILPALALSLAVSADVARQLRTSLVEVLEGTAAFDPAAVCSADSVQSVAPEPVNHPRLPQTFGAIPGLTGTSGMSHLFRNYGGRDVHEG